MEDLTLALITLTSFVLLFVVAIFADRAGIDSEEQALAAGGEPIRIPVEDASVRNASQIDADVA
ncbi:MAG: hypothetical protein H7287_13590 [Thermoleophilia bacterium]|nr:hypothetical protein [Thermoleophilia bacterium]